MAKIKSVSESVNSRKEFDLLIKEVKWSEWKTEYLFYPQEYQDKITNPIGLGEELFQPEIVLEKGKENFQVIEGMVVSIDKGWLYLDTGIHKRGLEKYKLKKHPSYDSFYGVDINKESLKSLIKHFKLGIEFRYLDELVSKDRKKGNQQAL